MRKAKSSLLRAGVFLLLFFPACSFAQTKVANDPSRIGVGARILGMGKGYVGVADDLCGIFINPAALPSIKNWQVTSMSGKFINEYDYISLGTAFPAALGVAGIGYVGSSIGFIAPAATTEVVDGIRIIPSTTEGVNFGFNDRVVLLSWGVGSERFSAGATLKMFSMDLSGPGIVNGTARGNEVDLGVHLQPGDAYKIGLVLQNALPFNYGGKIVWANQTEESLPSLLKLGLSFNLLGQGGWKLGDHKLSFNADSDFAPGRPNLPTLMHLGLEWSPTEYLDLRAGIDQDYVGRGELGILEAANNLTLGVGLYFGGYRFDYAYHQYNQVTDNDTHYFSLTYGVEKKKPVVGPAFSITPADRSVLFTENVSMEGQILRENIKRVLVNSEEAAVEKRNFRITLPLELKKNLLAVEGYDKNKLIARERVRILRLLQFFDVPSEHWASIPVSVLAMENVIRGYPDGSFRPGGNISRAEMCVLLIKASGVQLPSGEAAVKFKDVSRKYWAARYIARAVKEKLVKGYPKNVFNPNGKITRTEGVIMIARFAQLPEPRLVELPFTDIPGRYWAAKKISAASEAGILQYLKGKPFEPNKKLTRAEVAEMLSKTKLFAGKISDIMDWEHGY